MQYICVMYSSTSRPKFIQLILATSHNISIDSEWENELFELIKNTLNKEGHTVICVNGSSDHIHILCSMYGNEKIASLVKRLKNSTEAYINHQAWCKTRFKWYDGYGYHAYPHADIYPIMQDISNQKDVHTAKDFRQEYLALMKNKMIFHYTNA